MQFKYNSATFPIQKTLPQNVVDEMRDYLIKNGIGPHTTMGELQDLMLGFRTKTGARLLIHQLEPMFVYCAGRGCVWD